MANEAAWSDYQRRFKLAAESENKGEAYVERCLAYAEPLFARGLPVVYSHVHLSGLLGIKLRYLYACASSPGSYYRKFEIKKAQGGTRQLREPHALLKSAQQWLLTEVLERLPVSECAFAYVKGRRIKDHASRHVRKAVVVRLDIRDFFPSFKREAVLDLFASVGYSHDVAGLLASLCCLDGGLPQGAPTSPTLSNLLMLEVDRQLLRLAQSICVRYSRYADDMVFSGRVPIGFLVNRVRRILKSGGMELNDSKTRVMRASRRQEVCGVVVNRGLSVRREVKRQLRLDVHYIRTNGLEEHQIRRSSPRRARYLEHLLGIATWVCHIEPQNSAARVQAQYLRGLLLDYEQRPEKHRRVARRRPAR